MIVTLPLMMALERLSPLERAAFLLHDVFGVGFEEIAETIDREPGTCRQLASRARTHVRAARPRFHVPKERGLRDRRCVLRGFAQRRHATGCDRSWRRMSPPMPMAAVRTPAATQPIVGLDDVMQLHASLARNLCRGRCRGCVRYGFINGLPGFVTVEQGDMLQTTALQIENGKIVAIYVTRNPDKLRHLEGRSVH